MKKLIAAVLSLMLLMTTVSCLAEASQDFTSQLNEEMSAFEITAAHRKAAAENSKGYDALDAGRGNPNWINTQARYAYLRMSEFALSESERILSVGSLAGHAEKDGIGERFDAYMNADDETDAFLIEAVNWCVANLSMDKDTLLKELVDALIGDYYPTPSRCLTCTESILNAYLESVLYNGISLADETEVFPVEGGTAAMVYIFNSLNHNKLLNPGDTIAIATPIFTPYLEIPEIEQYSLISVDVNSTEEDSWDIPAEELEKLADPGVKAFFLVNPSNPAAHALSQNTLDKLAEIVEKNPELIILTDDVYGTFTKNFETVYARLPYNTILVYSFSKLYGVTGWRTGVIAMNKNNICDRLISELSDEDKASLQKDYSSVMPDITNFKFIDRMVADSRSIGLYHTAGLNTSAQAFMDMMALTHLVCAEEDPYIAQTNAIVRERYTALMEALSLPINDSDDNSMYYTLINLNTIETNRYGEDFAAWMEENVSELDFLSRLASEEGVVLMYGPGFNTPEGYARVSLANLNKEDYVEIARRLFELLDEYNSEYSGALNEAA